MPSFVSFQPTRVGPWIIKMSCICHSEHFLVVAIHKHTHECRIRTFVSEEDFYMYVNYLYVSSEND